MISLTWDERSGDGEGKVRIQKNFLKEHRITQLDGLKDWIGELTNIYEDMLTNETLFSPLNHKNPTP
jgi:hypothetical protein